MKYFIILWLLFFSSLFVCCKKDEEIKFRDDIEAPPQSSHSQQQKDTIITPDGWKYFDGDEFNSTAPDPNHWGLYGASGVGNSKYGQGGQGMLQTYRSEQVSMRTLPTGEKVCTITSLKEHGAPTPMSPANDQPGWWSGALSSRDANKFYPLFSRIEIRAEAPYIEGVWHAFWLRFYNGAGTAELDLQEFFVKWDKPDTLVQQTAHFWNKSTNKTQYNVDQKKIPVNNPDLAFHVYGVQIDSDPNHENEAIITFFLDGRITTKFSTAEKGLGKYNRFIEDAKKDGRMNSAWDFAITGQVGGTNAGVRYPSSSVNKVETNIDWVRCYVRE